MADGKAFYRAALVALDMKALGCVHGGKKDVQPDVTVKVSCHSGTLGPYFQTKLTVSAPTSMNCPENKYSTYSKLYAGAVSGYRWEQVTEDNIRKVPNVIRNTHLFDATALAYQDNKPGVIKLTISYAAKDATHEGLYNTLSFKGYIDPETDEDLGDKPHVQHAVNSLKELFSNDRDITFYIRNEELNFMEEFDRLYEAMDHEHENGHIIHKFYKSGSTVLADGSFRAPHLQVNQHLVIQDRPNVSTSKTYVHRDFTDFSTRKGYAAIQSMEYEKQEVLKFNSTPGRVKFVTIPGEGHQKYLAVFYIDQEVEKRLQSGDILWINFAPNLKDQITTTEWKTQIIDPLPWLKSGETAGIVSRPREPFPEGATPEQMKIPHDFIKGVLPAGNGEVATDELLRGELDRQRYIHVSFRLETSDLTQRRQINALCILQRAQKLDPEPLPGAKACWIDRPMLANWQERLCNKSQLPDKYTNILGEAESYLTHLDAPDHRDVVNYLKAVPTLNSIALGIIQGRAGVGKTYVIAATTTAMLRADPKKKILILAPSNEPCNVVARKVAEEMSKYPQTKDLIVMRAHNLAAGKNYVVAYAKLETLKARIAADKLKTTEELDAQKARQVLINQKKARDAEAEAQEKKAALAELAKNLPGKQPKRGPSGGEDIIVPNSDDETQSGGIEGEPEMVLDPEVLLSHVMPTVIQKFNDEVVVSQGCFRADGSIDVERLERDNTLGKASAGLRLAKYLSAFMSPGDRLINDSRFQEIRQSLAWTILVVAGELVPDKNAFTDASRWAGFRVLFKKFMEEGDYMDADERNSLDISMKSLREYCVSITSILVSTENKIASGLYVQNFPAELVIIDENNRSLITDTCIAIAHFEPATLLLVGDTKQLKPVVIGPTPPTGFLPELEVSTMSYFLESGWPSVIIYIQRRSRAGVMDIPVQRFYHGKVVNEPNAHSNAMFKHTRTVIDIVSANFPDQMVRNFPSMFFEIIGSVAEVDPITKSRFNLRIASFVVNMIELLVQNGIPPRDQGVVTPYMAQVMVYKYAINQLHLQFPLKGYNELLIGTADSMGGEERPVMHTDTVVTHEIGFSDDKGRLLVMTTRAKHASLNYGNTASLYQKHRRESDLIGLFNTAKSYTRRICREIPEDSEYQNHRFVQNRTI